VIDRRNWRGCANCARFVVQEKHSENADCSEDLRPNQNIIDITLNQRVTVKNNEAGRISRVRVNASGGLEPPTGPL
jgi:hypothetical protein